MYLHPDHPLLSSVFVYYSVHRLVDQQQVKSQPPAEHSENQGRVPLVASASPNEARPVSRGDEAKPEHTRDGLKISTAIQPSNLN